MNLDEFLRREREIATAPADELTVRRVVNRVQAEQRRTLASPEAFVDMRAALGRFAKAEQALADGRRAEENGDLIKAATLLRLAAEEGLGDATLRLAGVLTKLQEYDEALRWCAVAEKEGFEEAADLAVRCRDALGQPAPLRKHDDRPTGKIRTPAPIKEHAHVDRPRHAGRSLGPSSSADLGLTRRLKALACTVPLHELDAHKKKLDWTDASVYQMAEIAMHTIDQVTIAMDFDTGAAHDDVVDRVSPFVAAQAPDRAVDEHQRVARWVLEKLINVGIVDRVFRQIYGEIDAAGDYQRRTFDFKLLREVPGSGSDIYLRATDEAINVLVGALDTDVESAQVAAEVKLENLISRGRLTDARLAAEQARYRTVQYGEMLRHKLDATSRDVRLVDWEQELPEMLDSALDHIEGRFKVEHAILRNITDARDESDEPEQKGRAAELVDIVNDCIRRHTQLQNRLQSARALFRGEQDRQQFSGPPQRAALNLHGQLLAPLLDLPIVDAVGPLEGFFRAASGVGAVEAVSLPALVSMLLRPVADRDRTAGPVVSPTLDVMPDASRFTEEHWRMSDVLLDFPGEVRTLAAVLGVAASLDSHLPVLVALRASNACSPAVNTAVARGNNSVLVAVASGGRIDPSRTGGIGGDDLILTTAEVVVPSDEQDLDEREDIA